MGLWALDCEQEGGVTEHEPSQARRDPDLMMPEVGGWGVSMILAKVGLGQWSGHGPR